MLTEEQAYVRLASIIENTLNVKASDDARRQVLQDIGKGAAESIAEMVAALECDYDRLAYLRELRDECKEHLGAGDPPSHYDMAADDKAELAELEKAAGDCESQDEARERIQDDPLEITLAGTWALGAVSISDVDVDRAYILLGTGGPATRIVCELDEHMEPHRAWIEAQDWGTPWTEYHGDAASAGDLLTYCRCLYFGED